MNDQTQVLAREIASLKGDYSVANVMRLGSGGALNHSFKGLVSMVSGI